MGFVFVAVVVVVVVEPVTLVCLLVVHVALSVNRIAVFKALAFRKNEVRVQVCA